MAPVTPYWFKQRQGKVEEAGPDTVRISGPNMREAFLGIRSTADGRWQAFLRLQPEDPDSAVSDGHERNTEGWEAAFELYRTQVIF